MALNIPSLSEIISQLNTRLTSFFGSSFNTNPNTPNGNIVRMIANSESKVYQALQYVFRSSRFCEAEGTDLDTLMSLIGIVRRVRVLQISNVSLVGKPNRTVLAGSLAATSPLPGNTSGNYLFYLTSNITLSASGTGTGDFIQYGFSNIPVNVPSGHLNKVVSVLRDTESQPPTQEQIWTRVYNSSASSIIDEVETDLQFRNRAQTRVNGFRVGYPSSVRAAMLSNPLVTNAIVYERTQASDTAPSNQPNNSLFAMGYWETTGTQTSRLIAESMADTIPPCLMWNGVGTPNWGDYQTSVSVSVDSGVNVNVGLARAKRIQMQFYLQINQVDNINLFRTAINEVLYTFFKNPTINTSNIDPSKTQGLGINENLEYLGLACLIRERSVAEGADLADFYFREYLPNNPVAYSKQTQITLFDQFLSYNPTNDLQLEISFIPPP